MRPWDNLIGEDEKTAYEAAGFGRSAGLGERPALLIIDVQYRTTGTHSMPFSEAVREFPTSCGEVAWRAVEQIVPLLGLFRERNWPVIYPHVAPKTAQDGGRLAGKIPTIMAVPPKGYEFVAEIAPVAGDILIPKKHPSAFFGTALASHLIDLKVDTLVATGCTTSGCVRASVVDAFSYNFHVAVPADCVYDRGATPHAANLFDMAQKYAEVLSSAELAKRLAPLPARI
ncbi:MAG: isochorismatase family protein [Mesorhizobium sp.]|uniref:isochorismatase family protein n=1 Tax=Mesorhizobium sp. TaxID=1871066 RepID=UPI000FE973E0|nr:isochorismatase family protein [Mesorhizobium sp.]RWI50505.1 MAG: isochorismatase family protein [Mesorhizobium sp.]